MGDKELIVTSGAGETKDTALFLGAWCLAAGKSSKTLPESCKVIPYHWDDRKKLYQDQMALQSIYEACLIALAERLNTLHKVNFSIRYWRIVVGPWLLCFIPSVFDRWTMVARAQSKHDVGSILLQHDISSQSVPHNMNEFLKWHSDDPWNEALILRIAELAGLGLSIVPFPSEGEACVETVKPVERSASRGTSKGGYITLIRKILSVLMGRLMKRERVVIVRSGMSVWQYVRINLRFRQIPSFSYTQTIDLVHRDPNDRDWNFSIKSDVKDTEFSPLVNLLETLIPEQIPTAYVEGFEFNRSSAKSSQLSECPKAIYAINRWMNDDGFKFWLAEALENGARFLLGQHGGFFGLGQWSSMLDHQIKISDKFLTWGWSNSSEKVRPLGVLIKALGRKTTPPRRRDIVLMPQMAMSRYATYMSSWPVAAGQWNDYFDEQAAFLEQLPQQIRDQLVVRIYPKGDYGLMQHSRWQERYPDIMLDVGDKPMQQQLASSKLLVANYNATTFLEGFIQNIPTMMFWSPYFWELDEAAEPYFDILERAGIFHRSAESAAMHLIDIWPNIDKWWNHPDTQAARRLFCDRFAVISHDGVAAIHAEICEELTNQEMSVNGIV